jgi:hypothetical protein
VYVYKTYKKHGLKITLAVFGGGFMKAIKINNLQQDCHQVENGG